MSYYKRAVTVLASSICLNFYAYPLNLGDDRVVYKFNGRKRINELKEIIKLNQLNYNYSDRRYFSKRDEVLVDPHFKFNYCKVKIQKGDQILRLLKKYSYRHPLSLGLTNLVIHENDSISDMDLIQAGDVIHLPILAYGDSNFSMETRCQSLLSKTNEYRIVRADDAKVQYDSLGGVQRFYPGNNPYLMKVKKEESLSMSNIHSEEKLSLEQPTKEIVTLRKSSHIQEENYTQLSVKTSASMHALSFKNTGLDNKLISKTSPSFSLGLKFKMSPTSSIGLSYKMDLISFQKISSSSSISLTSKKINVSKFSLLYEKRISSRFNMALGLQSRELLIISYPTESTLKLSTMPTLMGNIALDYKFSSFGQNDFIGSVGVDKSISALSGSGVSGGLGGKLGIVLSRSFKNSGLKLNSGIFYRTMSYNASNFNYKHSKINLSVGVLWDF